MSGALTYAETGVNIDKANALVTSIKEIAKKTHGSGVMGEIGGFGGLFSLNLSGLEKPVLVSSSDGVGTKLKIAFMMNKHDTVGIDLVAMCVNDIAVQGAKPLFFLDYLSMGKLNTQTATEIIKGIAEGCKQTMCALIGGETAEMPGFYKQNEYDLAGFAVGIVDNDKIVDGSEIHVGNRLIGIASNGLHSNGYSLVRNICFDVLKLKIDSYGSWDVPPIFHFLQQAGNISDKEMMRTFNNGIGLIAVVREEAVQDLLARLDALNEKAFIIGEIVGKKEFEERVAWI